MTETYWPFISGQGTPVDDPQWSLMGRYWLQTGVIKGFWNELNVTANGSAMQVTVDTGAASIMGEWYKNDALKQVPIAAADATNPRIDVIAMRVDWAAYTVSVVVLTGTPAANPVAPPLTQSDILSGGTRWEIALANVNVPAGATTISASDVVDVRTFTGNPTTVPAPGLPAMYDSTGKLVVSSNLAGVFSNADTWHTLTLLNGFTALGSPFSAPQYRKDASGWIHIIGAINLPASVTNPIATLPAGYRPGTSEIFGTQSGSGSNGYAGRVDIDTNGNIQYEMGDLGGYMTFSGISFLAEN